MMKLSRLLYRWSRRTRDLEALASGDPEKVARRGRNKLLGRALGRVTRGLWR